MIHLVLLSGGSGTRLWPLSNNARSKQFLKVLRDESGNPVSMVQRVFQQIETIQADVDVTIATCISQENAISSQIASGYSLVLEPERRDTAAAIMLACANLDLIQGASPGETVIVMPIDTYAGQGFYDCVVRLDESIQSSEGDIALLGVTPTYPSEKYGYIVPRANDGDVLDVARFVEKPNEDYAREMIADGAFWNCGVFAFRLGFMRDITKRYVECSEYEQLLSKYDCLPNRSFDYEIVENADSITVIPYSGVWKDLGTWNTLCEEMEEYCSGRVVGVETCDNTHIINELGLPMVVLGSRNLVVVATSDGILVSDKQASSHMKPFVNEVAECRPMYEQRSWGEYRVIDSGAYRDGTRSLSKELVVNAGNQLSYQRHRHRTEVWTIVSGTGDVVLDGKVTPVVCGTVITIQPLQMHAVRAIDDLHIIEVQIGDVLEEEDIERFGHFWDD